ncbi:MAG: LysR family transcriptional regulator substrate-binding protein [Lachnospiraceae bacterium]|nr:LysR family transcriptional regulator substrate-binding protein [Lachnospiraceae bacterium]
MLAFLDRYPQYHIDQHRDTLSQFAEKLLSGALDFVLTGMDDLKDICLDKRPLLDIGVCLCMRQDHPLADRESISLNELSGESVISLSKELPYQQFCEQLFR